VDEAVFDDGFSIAELRVLPLNGMDQWRDLHEVGPGASDEEEFHFGVSVGRFFGVSVSRLFGVSEAGGSVFQSALRRDGGSVFPSSLRYDGTGR